MTAAELIDRNLSAYGARDLDALAATFSDDVEIGPLNGAPLARGRAAGRQVYARTIELFPLSGTQSMGRIALAGHVIDIETSARTDGHLHNVATIYTLRAGEIARIETIVSDLPAVGGALAERQLASYNAQDLDAYCACFSADMIIAEYGEPPASVGREALRARYAALFESYPQNRAEVLARYCVGAVVIDHERVQRAPDSVPFEVVAIYTVVDGLIARIDFVR